MYSAFFLCNFSNSPDYPATKFQSSSSFERNHRTSGAAAWEHEPKMDFSTTVKLNLVGTASPFALYSVVHRQTMTPKQLVGSSIDVVDERGGGTAMFFKLFSLLR